MDVLNLELILYIIDTVHRECILSFFELQVIGHVSWFTDYSLNRIHRWVAPNDTTFTHGIEQSILYRDSLMNTSYSIDIDIMHK